MIKILFICHGNICRSPMAEFLMKDIIKKKQMENDFFIESAAVSNEELGNPVDFRVQELLKKEYDISCKGKYARKITKTDYETFDYILYMDHYNFYFLDKMFPGDPKNKMKRLLDFTSSPRDVDDPWYTGNFTEALSDIKEGIEAFLKFLEKTY